MILEWTYDIDFQNFRNYKNFKSLAVEIITSLKIIKVSCSKKLSLRKINVLKNFTCVWNFRENFELGLLQFPVLSTLRFRVKVDGLLCQIERSSLSHLHFVHGCPISSMTVEFRECALNFKNERSVPKITVHAIFRTSCWIAMVNWPSTLTQNRLL